MFAVACLGARLAAQIVEEPGEPREQVRPLSERQWRQLDRAVDRGLAWLATQQAEDGSFETYETGQPGVTALVVLAYMSRGHLPGEGENGTRLERAVKYLLERQSPDGLLVRMYPAMPIADLNPTHTSSYNHAITGLCLSELYSEGDAQTSRQIRSAIERAIEYTARRMPVPKRDSRDVGGWRYGQYKPQPPDSDLSVTSWQLMFLRSCRNAGFEVPTRVIDEALAYVRRCHDPQTGAFFYGVYGTPRRITPAMTGAGILSLALGGQHETEQARRAGAWLLQVPPSRFRGHDRQRYYYDMFYVSQAMFQLGGKFWEGFYPDLLETLSASQQPDGSWPLDPHRQDRQFGHVYTTALAVLALSPPYQLLPIFQR